MPRPRVVFIPKGASVHDRYLKGRRRWCVVRLEELRTEISKGRRRRTVMRERLDQLRRRARRRA